MPTPSFDLAQAHRWFAIEYNNEAWDLIELPVRTAEQSERLYLAAHASVAHWREVGKPINELRGLLLLAAASMVNGRASDAKEYAQRCVERCGSGMEGLTEFDRASAFGALAIALQSTGEIEAANAAFAQAQTARAELPEDDRGVFDKLYGQF